MSLPSVLLLSTDIASLVNKDVEVRRTKLKKDCEKITGERMGGDKSANPATVDDMKGGVMKRFLGAAGLREG